MDWAGTARWRKALIISVLVHSLVLTSAGWLAAKTWMPAETPETLIELALVSEAQISSLMTESVASQANLESVPAMQQTVPAETTKNLDANPAAAVVPVAAAGAMDVVAVDNTSKSGGQQIDNASNASSEGISGSSPKPRDISPPGILSRREPSYPEKARSAGIEGTVVLKIEILENGRAGNISIQASSGSELLDEAAADAVQRWRFIPAKVRSTGKALVCYTTMPVVFKLKV